MTFKAKRLIIVMAIGALLGLAVLLVLAALRENIVYFYTPSELSQLSKNSDQQIRIGGLVKDKSLDIDGLQSLFIVTDGTAEITVRYNNALPSLFREGQGVVAEGYIENSVFFADNVLAKHDENYMPADVAEKLKKQGLWQGNQAR